MKMSASSTPCAGSASSRSRHACSSSVARATRKGSLPKPQDIKNGRTQDDVWIVLCLAENDEAATVWVPAGRVIVPLAVWQVRRPQLAGRAEAGRLGVWLTGDTELAELAEGLAALL